MDQRLTKKQFIDAMRVERARWEMLLLRVGAGRMWLPVGEDGPSVVDMVTALYEQERQLVGLLASIQELSANLSSVQRLNSGHNSAANLVEASREAFNEILRLLIPITEEDLFATDRFDTLAGRALAELVSACTVSYYLEHDPPIRSWLAQPLVQAV
jgi:hypothetical protein